MEKLNCLIVDDDKLDRLMVISFVKRYPYPNLIGAYESAQDAMIATKDDHIDIVFLNIDISKS